jgi:hypothetical protein
MPARAAGAAATQFRSSTRGAPWPISKRAPPAGRAHLEDDHVAAVFQDPDDIRSPAGGRRVVRRLSGWGGSGAAATVPIETTDRLTPARRPHGPQLFDPTTP